MGAAYPRANQGRGAVERLGGKGADKHGSRLVGLGQRCAERLDDRRVELRAGTAPKFGDRRSHQMDPANAQEAIREVEQDIDEGLAMLDDAIAHV